MKVQFNLTASGEHPLQLVPHLPSSDAPKTRVAVVASFMGGYHVLRELLLGSLAPQVAIVGLATDDPTQTFTHAGV